MPSASLLVAKLGSACQVLRKDRNMESLCGEAFLSLFGSFCCPMWGWLHVHKKCKKEQLLSPQCGLQPGSTCFFDVQHASHACILPVKDGVCGSTKSEVLSHAKTEEAIYLQDLQGLKLSHPRPVYMPQSQVWPFAVRALWASKNTSLMHKVHVRRTRPDTNAFQTRP